MRQAVSFEQPIKSLEVERERRIRLLVEDVRVLQRILLDFGEEFKNAQERSEAHTIETVRSGMKKIDEVHTKFLEMQTMDAICQCSGTSRTNLQAVLELRVAIL